MTDLTKVKEWLKDADAVIVTAGNGMAKEEGLDILSEENFDDEYGKVADKYDVHTMGMPSTRSLTLGMNNGLSGVNWSTNIRLNMSQVKPCWL